MSSYVFNDPCDQSPIKLLAFEPQLPEGSAIIQRDQGVSKSMSPKLPDGIQQEIRNLSLFDKSLISEFISLLYL